MSNIFGDIEDCNTLIRQMEQLKSKIYAGHIVDAYRQVSKIISVLCRYRDGLIRDGIQQNPKNPSRLNIDEGNGDQNAE